MLASGTEFASGISQRHHFRFRPIRPIACGMGNLPTNFGVSMTLCSRLTA